MEEQEDKDSDENFIRKVLNKFKGNPNLTASFFHYVGDFSLQSLFSSMEFSAQSFKIQIGFHM
jgi:hypothetical protein